MKYILFLLLILPAGSFAQKWYSFSKNDVAIMGLEMGAGYAQGWKDEVTYHPNQLFKNHPGLNRNFWDIRTQGKKGFLNTEWDADHVLKFSVNGLHVTAISIKIGNLKQYPKKQRWKKIVFDLIKYYASYKVGFFLSYNVTHENKL
ncbi:MAG: hypothetical protein ABIP68_06595 [Ferruginibacter sp.]